jgi:hypothetical protein
MWIRLEGEIQRELQIQFLKPLFRTNSTATDLQRFLSMREIFALTVASASIAILFALGYLLTGWNPENFKDDVLNIVLTLLVIIVGIASSILVFGFRPRVVKFFERYEQESKVKRREHTKNLYKEVYKPLSHIFAEPNPRTSYTIEYMCHM